MGQLISILAVALFSVSSFAQSGLGPLPKTDFAPLIDQNILEQELTAEVIQKSTVTAANAESEHDLVESVKTVPTGTAQATTAQPPATAEKRTPANEKDFQVKLHPTGLSSAKRYFPPKPKVVKAPKTAKFVKAAKKSAKLAKAEKKTKVKKAKGNGRSTASIKKKSKKSTSQTANSVKI